MSEEWLPAPGFYARYLVSSLGRVRNAETGRILAGEIDRYGYRAVNLQKDGANCKRRVHRLVCEAFSGPPPEGTEAAHTDGNLLNNRADNLSWKTHRENNADKIAHGTHQAGERHPRVKLTAADVLAIRASDLPSRALGRIYGVNQSQIVRIKNGDRWAEGIAKTQSKTT